VASARFALRRPDKSDPPLEVEVALIRDWRKLLVVEGRGHRLEHLAQLSRARLANLRDQDHQLEGQAHIYEEQWTELSERLIAFEVAGQTEERDSYPLKARQLAADWEVRQRKTKREKNAARRLRILNKCEGSCRELRQVLRQQEDLEAQARDMYELDQGKDQLMTLFKMGLANVGMWVRDHYFGESYQHCGWQRLLPFFKLAGWVTTTASQVHLEFCALNNRALGRDARGGVSQSYRWRSPLARWQTVGGGSREAASYLSAHGAAGQYRLSFTLDM
jgi:hypothetical protein